MSLDPVAAGKRTAISPRSPGRSRRSFATAVVSVFAIEVAHLRLAVPRARDLRRWDRLLDRRDILRRQMNLQCPQRLVELLARSRAHHRHNTLALGEHPGDGDLRRSRSA